MSRARARRSSRRLFRFVASPRGAVVAGLLGVLLALPALTVGWLHDDLLHRLILEDGLPGYDRAPWQLYDFTTSDPGFAQVMRDRGYFPWFGSEGLTLRFFRPLSSLSLAADHALFGRDALMAHLHSLGWFVVLLVFVGLTLRRVLRPTSATLAIGLYAVAGSHTMATAWVAARHSLIGAAFGAACVWAHIGWRQEGDRWRAVLAPIALIAGMLSSETALGAVVFVVLFELLARRDAIGARAAAATPALALGVAHLVFYTLCGYGARHSGAYIAPFSDPVAFGGAVVRRIPMLAAEMYGGLPVATWVNREMQPILIGWGALSFVLVVVLIVAGRDRLRRHERRHLAWLGASSVICLAPMVGGFLGGRLLPLAQIGSVALLSSAMMLSWMRPARGVRRWSLRGAVVLLALLHFGGSVAVRLALPTVLDSFAVSERRIAEEAEPGDCRRAYLLTGGDPTLSLYAEQALAFWTPEKADRLDVLRVLSMAPQEQRITVIDERTFELEAVGARQSTPFEGVYSDAPPGPGETVEVGELSATVLEAEDGLPTRVRFEVEGGLASACAVRWDGERLLFEPIESGVVPHEPGPMGL